MEEHNMNITITLTDEQYEVIKDELQGYAEALANDRIIRKADRERSAKILALASDTDEELSAAIAPLMAAEISKQALKEKIIKG
jgi:hypothetical protein